MTRPWVRELVPQIQGSRRKGRSTESQLHSLEATRRLVMRVEAVPAVSWLWTSGVPTHAAAEGTGTTTFAAYYFCGFDPAGIDVADLEEEGWKAQGALGCPVPDFEEALIGIGMRRVVLGRPAESQPDRAAHGPLQE